MKNLIPVIVIDDDKNTTDVLSEILELMDMKVVGKGYDGNDAVSLYKKHHPDLVFIDLLMPEYDGFYAVDKIKEIDSDARIIVVTADQTKEIQEKIVTMNITFLIYKPFNFEQIRKIVNNILLS